MKKILMLAFHYPPFQGSSGVLRTLNFSKYLPDFGLSPIVLTAHPRAYVSTQSSNDPQGLQIPPNVTVHRSSAFDAARHFSLMGRYPRLLALPDRWATWHLSAVPAAKRIVRKEQPEVIWSTYPIATAHRIGRSVQRSTGLPWIADFRDSMTEEGYPADPLERAAYLNIERETMRHADLVVFTTEATKRMYLERYPERDPSTCHVIFNGYDEESFQRAESGASVPRNDERLVFVHSGVLYPVERDPRPFLDAMAALKQKQIISSSTVRIVFRASAHDDFIRPLLVERGVQDLVHLESSIPYTAALRELLSADGLLLFQAANCNHQIPAKLYEYLRAGRPIFALTDARGDTAATLRAAGIDTIANLADADEIASAFERFVESIGKRTVSLPNTEFARAFSRRNQTGEFARLVGQLCASRHIQKASANGDEYSR